jgi:hypothetical protein
MRGIPIAATAGATVKARNSFRRVRAVIASSRMMYFDLFFKRDTLVLHQDGEKYRHKSNVIDDVF